MIVGIFVAIIGIVTAWTIAGIGVYGIGLAIFIVGLLLFLYGLVCRWV
jgi:hypothetical protein